MTADVILSCFVLFCFFSFSSIPTEHEKFVSLSSTSCPRYECLFLLSALSLHDPRLKLYGANQLRRCSSTVFNLYSISYQAEQTYHCSLPQTFQIYLFDFYIFYIFFFFHSSSRHGFDRMHIAIGHVLEGPYNKRVDRGTYQNFGARQLDVVHPPGDYRLRVGARRFAQQLLSFGCFQVEAGWNNFHFFRFH